MSFKKVIAFIRPISLEPVEQKLLEIGVKGMSISQVKGFGEYINYFGHEINVGYTKIEILVKNNQVKETVNAIIDTAQTGHKGDGIVFIQSVEEVFRIRDGHEAEKTAF